jgi:predicted nucleic acid-binding protein
MVGLVDTNILVDILRNHPPAFQWFQTQVNLGITPVVYMELLSGASNQIKQRRAEKFLQQFQKAYLTEADMDWAIAQYKRYRLSHNLGILDSLIASPNYRLGIPLYTGNLKHFTPLLGILAQKPY